MNHPLARSLSLRLLAIFALVALLLVTILVTLFTQGLASQWRRSIAPHLVQYVRYVQEDLGRPPDPARAESLAARLPVTIAIYRDGEFVFATDDREPDLDALEFRRLPRRLQRGLTSDGDAAAVGEEGSWRRDDTARRERDRDGRRSPLPADADAVRAAIAREGRREGTVLRLERGADTVYYRLEPSRGQRPRAADGLYLGLAAVLLVLLGGYVAIRRQLAPIRRIQAGVRRISDGELGHRLGIGGRDDLAELGRSIDDMAARLGDMLDAKRQLLLAISHELRSPLARARVATELLPASRQRERLEADLAEMARLIEDLTESERLRTPHAALHRERLDLVALVAEEIAPHGLAPRVVGADPDHPPTPIVVHADAARLRVLLRNLVGNALRHGSGPDGTPDVTVTLEDGADATRLTVADRGPGIAPEHLEAVTEPFHRPDPSRARTSGGIGLGLSLARLVAEAHGGSLRVASDPAREPGTRVTVTLPHGEASGMHRGDGAPTIGA